MKQKKREALYLLYKKGLEDGRFKSLRDAGAYLSNHPAPCFFISPYYASVLVGKILSNKSLAKLHFSQRRMAWQLYYEYMAYVLTHPKTRKSRIQIMDEVTDKPAPEFYMTADAVRRALKIEIDDVKRRMGWGG